MKLVFVEIIDLLNSAVENIRNLVLIDVGAQKNDLKNLTDDFKMLKEKERLYILDILDKLMISLNESPLESITLPIFKYWYELFMFGNMSHIIIMGDNASRNMKNVAKSVHQKVFTFFFRSLLHFKKMNIKILDANINGPNSKSFLMLAIEKIKNCETIQDLIDASPNTECPVCMAITFTESTEFIFRISCNHLVCENCTSKLAEFNNWLVKEYIIFAYFD